MPEQAANPLLEQLRDIHVPAELGWWPPAIGWWILALAIIFIAYRLIRRWINQHHQGRYKKQALTELNQQLTLWQRDGNDAHYLQGVHALLVRVCLHLEGGRQLSAKTGQRWADDLNRYSAEELDQESVFALTQAAYQKEPTVDIERLHKLVNRWIKKHKRAPLDRSSLDPGQEPEHA